MDVSKPLTKGYCSGVIARLFSEPANEHLWAAYVHTTADNDGLSSELAPHDREALASVEIPYSGQFNGGPRMRPGFRAACAEKVCEILKEGSPFDDPLPDLISISETCFCFTGEFQFGTRTECQAAVTLRGGSITNDVNRKTDILVIGHAANPLWSHGTFGNKIMKAMIFRLQFAKPRIIPELFWVHLLSNQQ